MTWTLPPLALGGSRYPLIIPPPLSLLSPLYYYPFIITPSLYYHPFIISPLLLPLALALCQALDGSNYPPLTIPTHTYPPL